MDMWHCHADKEGFGSGPDSLKLFREEWNRLNAKRGFAWETNPYVWVVEFKLLTPNS
jgi:hypothetical protein